MTPAEQPSKPCEGPGCTHLIVQVGNEVVRFTKRRFCSVACSDAWFAENPNAKRQRSSHCQSGLHEMTGDNVRISNRGYRSCRACAREKDRLLRAAARAAKRGTPPPDSVARRAVKAPITTKPAPTTPVEQEVEQDDGPWQPKIWSGVRIPDREPDPTVTGRQRCDQTDLSILTCEPPAPEVQARCRRVVLAQIGRTLDTAGAREVMDMLGILPPAKEKEAA